MSCCNDRKTSKNHVREVVPLPAEETAEREREKRLAWKSWKGWKPWQVSDQVHSCPCPTGWLINRRFPPFNNQWICHNTVNEYDKTSQTYHSPWFFLKRQCYVFRFVGWDGSDQICWNLWIGWNFKKCWDLNRQNLLFDWFTCETWEFTRKNWDLP